MDSSTRAIDCTNNYFTSSKFRRPVFGRQSIRYTRPRCTPGVDAYTEIQSDVGCCCDTLGEPCSKHTNRITHSCGPGYYKLFNSTLSDHRNHIITHFIIIIHHYNCHHSFKPSLPSSLLSRTINIMIITIIIIISQIIIMLSSFIISSSLFTNVIINTLSYHLYDNHYL